MRTEKIVEKMTKGDYVEAVLNMDATIKEIDYAIPQSYANELRELDIEVSEYVWAYSEEKKFGYPLNVVSHWAKLYTSEG